MVFAAVMVVDAAPIWSTQYLGGNNSTNKSTGGIGCTYDEMRKGKCSGSNKVSSVGQNKKTVDLAGNSGDGHWTYYTWYW